jgi:acyl carrier protein
MKEKIRTIIKENAKLRANIESLDDSSDLYVAGMSSHASVTLMLALENEFGLEFPSSMLSRNVFSSVNSISGAIESLTGQQV